MERVKDRQTDRQAEAERAAVRTKTDRHMGKSPRCGEGCVPRPGVEGPTWTAAPGTAHRDTPVAGRNPLAEGHRHRSSFPLWLPLLTTLSNFLPSLSFSFLSAGELEARDGRSPWPSAV